MAPTGAQAARTWLHREFMTSGIQTDAAALNELAEYMTTSLNIEDVMERIVDYVDRGMSALARST